MKNRVLAVCFCLGLSGCIEPGVTNWAAGNNVSAASSMPFTAVTTSADFLSKVTGRNIEEGMGFFVINSDGTLNGVDGDGASSTGTWTWENGAWCRAFDRPEGQTEAKCRTIAVNDEQIRFVKVESGENQFYSWQ